MSELTKEQQVRALREARFAKRHSVTVTAKRHSVTAKPDKSSAALIAEIAMLQAEVRYLKEQLARRDKPIGASAERMRRLRAKRKAGKVPNG